MKKISKTYARRRHSSRKRQRKGDTFLLIIVGAAVVYLFALKYWVIFLWCVGILLLLLLLYITFRVTRYIKKQQQKKGKQTEIVRDSRYISPQLRQSVWNKCGGMCVQCHSRSLLEYDHIIPIAKGGATSFANLQILCRSCNRHKSDHI